MMCRVLKVSRSSYYYWLKEPRSQRKEHVKILKDKIQTVYFKAKGRYGSPRIKEELCRTGTAVSRPTVAKYMKQMGLKSKLARKFRVTTDSNHKEPVADNILNLFFTVKKMCFRYHLHSNKERIFVFDNCNGLVQSGYYRLESKLKHDNKRYCASSN